MLKGESWLVQWPVRLMTYTSLSHAALRPQSRRLTEGYALTLVVGRPLTTGLSTGAAFAHGKGCKWQGGQVAGV
jgi:hypothetical protein